MLPLKQMILPLVVFDMKKAEPIFLDGVEPPRLGISGPREGRFLQMERTRCHAVVNIT